MKEKRLNCYSFLFNHMIYEYKKGVRNLFLHTVHKDCIDHVILRLEKNDIDYFYYLVNETKINMFFGKNECVEIIRLFNIESLSKLTLEQDFILGIMLGYNCIKQCERYIKRANNAQFKEFLQMENNKIIILE